MLTKVNVKERENGCSIEITTAVNQLVYRISVKDGDNGIEVSTIDGSMQIKPSVSNQVKIHTNPNS